MDDKQKNTLKAMGLCLAMYVPIGQAALESGGLQFMKSPAVAIQRQDIVIGLDRVQVSYVFNNTASVEHVETLVFPLPYDYSSGLSVPRPNESINQISFQVNGQTLELNRLERAIHFSGTDVSAYLEKLGLPADPVIAMHRLDASSNMDSLRRKLSEMRLLDEKFDTPQWFARTYYYWQQVFPVGKPIHMQQSYKPRLIEHYTPLERGLVNKTKGWVPKFAHKETTAESAGMPGGGSSKLAAHLSQYCPTEQVYENILTKVMHSGKTELFSREVQFNLMQDDGWTGPIEKFTVKIEHPTNVQPLLCWSGPFKRLSASAVVFDAQDYLPMQNLKVLFVKK